MIIVKVEHTATYDVGRAMALHGICITVIDETDDRVVIERDKAQPNDKYIVPREAIHQFQVTMKAPYTQLELGETFIRLGEYIRDYKPKRGG